MLLTCLIKMQVNMQHLDILAVIKVLLENMSFAGLLIIPMGTGLQVEHESPF